MLYYYGNVAHSLGINIRMCILLNGKQMIEEEWLGSSHTKHVYRGDWRRDKA
jgi:hypothetical protein